MMAKDSEPNQLVASARRRGDLDDLADALITHANTLVEEGQIAEARLELDEAASIHRRRGRSYDEARCTHLAATLCRLEGDLDAAEARAEHALQLTDSATPIAVSAATELGEIALTQGNSAEAVDAYGRALAAGEAIGMVETAQAALLRKRAAALADCGRHQEATRDLEAAHERLIKAGEQAAATRVLVEKATALQQGGNVTEAENVIVGAMQIAEATEDHHALADLHILQVTQAVERGNFTASMAAAETARTCALQALAPVSYVSAVIAIAELAESSGDRLATYEALVVGWVTLGDLLGRDVARATFEPKLRELRERWGDVPFADIKADYEARRRAEMERY
jgi:tetratricopeptide (TPR) repeat protein